MRIINSSSTLAIPNGVTVDVKKRVVTVKGPRGSLTKDLKHMQIELVVDAAKKEVSATMYLAKRKQIACIQTALSTIRNMIKGVTEGFRYKLRFAYAHFPVNVTVDKGNVEVRNFLGEKIVRYIPLPADVKATRTEVSVIKDELVLTGNDLQTVSQTAARVHSSCLVKKKDIRKFLDGIYVQNKTTASQ